MKRNHLFLGLAFVTLMAVATSCTCRHEFVSVHDYIANNSGHKVTLTSDRKTVTIANDSTVFIGEALSQCTCPNLEFLFGDTLCMVLDDTIRYSFRSCTAPYDSVLKVRNPYHYLNWMYVADSSLENTLHLTFTVDEDFGE